MNNYPANDMTMQSEIFITIMVVVVLLFIVSILNMKTAINAKTEAEHAQQQAKKAKQQAEEARQQAEQQAEQAQKKTVQVQKMLQQAEQARQTIKKELSEIRKKEQPPLIILDEAENYTFETGSGKILHHFQDALQTEIIPHIEKMSLEYDCDVVEVYGYTDGQLYKQRDSNWTQMDEILLKYLEQNQSLNLNVTSNLELGMLRAASIVSFLKAYQAQDENHLKNIKTIRPYSGGQLILPNGKIAYPSDNQPDAQRRRIELRLSRSRDLHKRL